MMALKAGIKPNKIVFSGVGKTSSELNFAINKKILLINAESLSEIIEINRIAKLKNKKVRVGVRLNPNTDAKTLNQISTGKKENKFGVNKNTFHKIVDFCKNSKNIDLKCLSVHIGSQILDHKPYGKMLKAVSHILDKTNHQFEFIDLGGGMGINYSENNKTLNYKKYNTAINNFLKKHKVKIIFEPGRSIIGNTGMLVTKVIYIKDSGRKKFIILDAAMNDFIRPSLYGSLHNALPLNEGKNEKNIERYDVVGPICETGDFFIKNFETSQVTEGDLLAITNVGAYGSVLSSNYNSRPSITEIMIKEDNYSVVKKKQDIDEMIDQDILADWQKIKG